MEKLTMSMAIFHSKLLNDQSVSFPAAQGCMILFGGLIMLDMISGGIASLEGTDLILKKFVDPDWWIGQQDVANIGIIRESVYCLPLIKSNMALEDILSIGDFPIETPFSSGFPITTKYLIHTVSYCWHVS